jgi:hypothetical protein
VDFSQSPKNLNFEPKIVILAFLKIFIKKAGMSNLSPYGA